MIGMDRHTGASLSGVEHLRQSIVDILTTPLGSRRMRPAYGCQLRRFVDMPVTAGWKSSVQAEVAHALNLWEPRFKLQAVRVTAVLNGVISFELKGVYLGDSVAMEVGA